MALLQRGESTNCTIGEKSYFEGRFSVKGSLRIDGKFEGEMLDVDQLFIGSKGRVKTNINASNVVVEGLVIGDIHAKNRVYLLPQSKIYGNITTPELIVQNGVTMDGHCNVAPEDIVLNKDLFENIYKDDK